MTLVVQAAGMVTAVGLDAASSCAAMRARIDGFAETRFVGSDGNWMIGAAVPLPRNWIGQKRMVHLAAGAMVDILDSVPDLSQDDALILCLAERDRPGKPVIDIARFAEELAHVTKTSSKIRTRIIENGRPSGFAALQQAEKLIAEGKANRVLVVGVDSYLTTRTISDYRSKKRIMMADNHNGFIPGEAAAAILVGKGKHGLRLSGLGLAREEAFIYNQLEQDGLDRPLRADGMVAAYRQAFEASKTQLGGIEYRISDLIGDKFFFQQAALTTLRLERGRSEFQDLWSPAESLGNVGAAVVPIMIGQALYASQKGYSMGSPLLIEASGDEGACAAAVFHETERAVWRRAS
ncbi:3-oxoacyl-ACP synthase [Rhodobacteraceae bacterium]|nr:3-oxoacyl-ACP synthase [Paracoccaceae bacterium]